MGATFGRGFYVLDDYAVLRDVGTAVTTKSNTLFPVRDAWWYVPSEPMQAKGMPTLGSTSFASKNPPFGAVFTYYLDQLPTTTAMKRQEAEKITRQKNTNTPFPGWETLRSESNESAPQVLLLVSNENGDPIRWIAATNKKGLHRANWDLRLPAPNPINLSTPAFKPPWAGNAKGPLAAPGNYTVALFIEHNGDLQSQGEAQSFTVKPVSTAPSNTDFQAVANFQKKTSDLMREIASASGKLSEINEQFRYINAALKQTPKANAQHFAQYKQLKEKLADLRLRLSGDPIRRKLDESTVPSISSRVGQIVYGHWDTRQMPTQTYQDNLTIATNAFTQFKQDLKTYLQEVKEYETVLEAAGAPYTRGRGF